MLFKFRTRLFPREGKNENEIIFMTFYNVTRTISSKFGTKHPNSPQSRLLYGGSNVKFSLVLGKFM